MNYEELKPWQISQLVHNHVECNGEFKVTFNDNKCQWSHENHGDFEFSINEAKSKVRPYSSDVNFAWPIITENCISIDCWGGFWGADIQKDGEIAFEHEDKNPLRAAMICFLKMKDSECKS